MAVGALLAALAAPRDGTVTVGGGENVDRCGENVDRYGWASSMNTAGDTWK